MLYLQSEIRDVGPGQIGGKAYNLGRLIRYVEVPKFCVISPTRESLEDDIARCQSHFLSHDANYAVRSSASIEDGERNSFAGMFETELNVVPRGIPDAIRRVALSGNSDRLKSYLAGSGLEASLGRDLINVVVQEMVDPDVSGVALSHINSVDDPMIVEAVWGLGELLVSGLEEPDQYFIDRSGNYGVEVEVGQQNLMLRSEGRVLVPSHLRNARKLQHDRLIDLRDTVLMLEQKLGLDAIDVEFCFKGDALIILQARSYTSVEK